MTQTFTRTRTEARYVCGFLFCPGFHQVALVRKTHPDWQAGRYNGVGGLIEPGETPHQAMAREFREESGVHIPIQSWDFFCQVKDAARGGVIYFFKATTDRLWDFRKDTDERVNWVGVEAVGALPILTNLTWLIPLAWDPDLGDDQVTNVPEFPL